MENMGRIKRHKKQRRKRKVNGENKKMQTVPKGENNTHEGEIKCEGVKYRITGKIKGTRAKEKNERLRGEMKSADSANGENKKHEGENKV